MISLIITILLMLIILSTIGFTATTSLQIKFLNNMYSDIRILDEKIAIYYLKYGNLPTTSSIIEFDKSINVNDNKNYYEIDLNLLEGVSLNNMKDTATVGKDKYIIDEQSHTIYYQKGVIVKEETIHTIPFDYKAVNL